MDYNPRVREQEWLYWHRHEFAGQWVSLDGDSLVAYGESAKAVLQAARNLGCDNPLVVHIPSNPDRANFGGW